MKQDFINPKPEYLAKIQRQLQERIPMWVIYNQATSDYPGRWVTRLHLSLPNPEHTRFVLLRDTLQDIRDALPPGLTRMNRDPNDDANIVEVWL